MKVVKTLLGGLLSLDKINCLYNEFVTVCPFILPPCPLSENSIIIARVIFADSESIVPLVRL